MPLVQRAFLGAVTINFAAGGSLEVRHDTAVVDDATGDEVTPRAFHRFVVEPYTLDAGRVVARAPEDIADIPGIMSVDALTAIARVAWTPEVVTPWLGVVQRVVDQNDALVASPAAIQKP